MNKYIVIYHADAAALAGMQDATPEQMAEGMKPWMTWAENCGDGLLDMGTPLGGGLKLSSSGSSGSDREVTGYSILQAENMAAAEAMLQGHPHLGWAEGCEIEVHEAMPLPGSS
jgi:hypothetical protein